MKSLPLQNSIFPRINSSSFASRKFRSVRFLVPACTWSRRAKPYPLSNSLDNSTNRYGPLVRRLIVQRESPIRNETRTVLREKSIGCLVAGKPTAIKLEGRVPREKTQAELTGERLEGKADGEVHGESCPGVELEHRRLLLHRSAFPSAVAAVSAVDGDGRVVDDDEYDDVRCRRSRRRCRWSWRWRWRSRWTDSFSWASHVFEQPCCRHGTAGDADDANDVGATVGEL